MKSKYEITETIKEEVKDKLKQEKRVVVKERLTAVHMYINGMNQEKVARLMGQHRGFVSRAVNNYFRIGIEGIKVH